MVTGKALVFPGETNKTKKWLSLVLLGPAFRLCHLVLLHPDCCPHCCKLCARAWRTHRKSCAVPLSLPWDSSQRTYRSGRLNVGSHHFRVPTHPRYSSQLKSSGIPAAISM